MKKTCFRLGWVLALGLIVSLHAAPILAVTKSVKGTVRVSQAGAATQTDLKVADLLLSGSHLETGENGKVMVRFLKDESFLDIRPKTQIDLKGAKAGGTKGGKLMLKIGEVVFGMKKKSLEWQCESDNSVATASKAKYSFVYDEKAVSTIIIQEGEVKVYNRPKDANAVVRAGQKAVSDLNGIHITDASDAELEQVGFRQSALEVDFMNPQTEELSTLEIEYETDF